MFHFRLPGFRRSRLWPAAPLLIALALTLALALGGRRVEPVTVRPVVAAVVAAPAYVSSDPSLPAAANVRFSDATPQAETF